MEARTRVGVKLGVSLWGMNVGWGCWERLFVFLTKCTEW